MNWSSDLEPPDLSIRKDFEEVAWGLFEPGTKNFERKGLVYKDPEIERMWQVWLRAKGVQ
jgi:hypothetical protein